MSDAPSWIDWVTGVVGGTLAFAAAWVWKIKAAIDDARRQSDLNLAGVENELRDKIDALDRRLQQNFESAMRLIQAELGEIKDMLHKNEIFVRDTFARRDTLNAATTEIKLMFSQGLDKLERQMRDDRAERSELMERVADDYRQLSGAVAALGEQNNHKRREDR